MKETAQAAYDAFMASANPDIAPDWGNMPNAHREHWRAAAAEAVAHDRLYIPKFGEADPPWACRIEAQQKSILEAIHTMSTTAVTRDQLDAAIQTLIAAEAQRDAVVTTALNDLIAKVASGTVAPEDFTAELNEIATLQANAAALTTTATADDPGPTTVPTTPIVATDGTTAAGTGSTNTSDATAAEKASS